MNLHRRICENKAKRKKRQPVNRNPRPVNSLEMATSRMHKRKRVEVSYIEEAEEAVEATNDLASYADVDDIVDDSCLSDASLEETPNELDEDLEEDLQPGVLVSIPTGGTFERILNLKEWLKQWTED